MIQQIVLYYRTVIRIALVFILMFRLMNNGLFIDSPL